MKPNSKILIIAGGYSNEREISLKTVRSVYLELKKSKKYIIEVTEPDGNFVKKIKSLTNIPVCSGFGIKSPEDAKKVANSGCNGVIVGSTFVKYIQDNINALDLTQSFGKQVQSFSEVLK